MYLGQGRGAGVAQEVEGERFSTGNDDLDPAPLPEQSHRLRVKCYLSVNIMMSPNIRSNSPTDPVKN